MGARQAVLLIPSKPSGPTQLLSYKQRPSVSPLFATLTNLSQLTENTAALSPFLATLTASIPVSPLFATPRKLPGVSFLCLPFWNSSSPQTLRTSAYSATLRSPFPPLFPPPHSSQVNKAQFPL